MVDVFLPCRSGSQRIKNKNIKPFAKFKFGLLEIKLSQLLRCERIRRIYLSSDDPEVLAYAKSLSSPVIHIHSRDPKLSSSETSTDQLILHVLDLMPDSEDILWTHVTSPFVGSTLYTKMIKDYEECVTKGFDSLMCVTPIQSFLWNENSPLNYDSSIEKWPRTQTLGPVFEVNSAGFLASKNIYLEYSDRIGKNPYFFEMGKLNAFDIDWPEEFLLAEQMFKSGVVSIR